ncbi:AsmA-like C-terminal region-containing protein [Rufibacter sediminis]|uniref:AsmA family protein n=1 Tax=Rufibacter sediminis TaxID=2762756 RepID=A0ABR6VRJ9_9BACT|nr:AsmA-like C-terminal region-containing protein [Rufibacter sediminis]MBC3539483.1 AsmA family protein [Rufibacter sediminis]
MRKVFIGLAIFIVVLLAAAALVPILFKDKIKERLDKEIAKSINARVLYETNNVSLSIFRTFPDLGLSVKELTIVGKDSFQRDTLAYLPDFSLGLDLMSVISGDQIEINSVQMDEPRIKLLVLKSGKANWDIFIPDSAATPETQDTTDFKMGIEEWNVSNGQIVYQDLSIPFAVNAYNVQHTGSGDLAKDVFDMETKTQAERFTMTYGGVNYIENKKLDADVTMAMDLTNAKYTFKDNNFRINDFALGMAGSIAMPSDDINLDLTFKALETDFKNIFSLVPGVFTDKFKDVKTDGKVAFNGYVKGIFNETTMPGFGVDLKVNDGTFQYPDLPQAARNINIDMSVKNTDGNVNNTLIDVRKLHLDLGKNPVDGRVVVDGLEPMKIDGNLRAKLDLAEVTKVFPLEGTTLRGLLDVDAQAKGVYFEKHMPVVTAKLNLTNGYVKSSSFPAPLEQVTVASTVVNRTGNAADTDIQISRFRMLLDKEPLEGRVSIKNLAQPQFDADVKGVLDLTKLTKIFPIDGTTLSGRLNGNILAKGKMTDVDAGRYGNVQASGTVQIANLNYKSTDLPQGMRINSAKATFNNEQVALQQLNGFLGKSDVQMNGTVSNYMGYLFSENQPLRGNFTLNTTNFNVNEWMVDEHTGQAVPSSAPQAQGVVQVPANLDVVLTTQAGTVVYDNLKLQNLKGKVTLKDQIARLEDVTFNTLGGQFSTTGSYDSRDLIHPTFSFGLDIKNLDFQQSFNSFNTIQKLAPIAKLLKGEFSTKFNFSGELGSDMMPVLSSLSGKGMIEVVEAVVTNVQALSKISQLTNLKEVQNFTLKNRGFAAEIVGGNLVVKPFDFAVGDIKMTVGGTNNVSGKVDYVVAMDVPSGKVGNALAGKITSLTGVQNLNGLERVTLQLGVTGNYNDPAVALKGSSLKAEASSLVKQVVTSKLDDVKEKLNVNVPTNKDSLKAELAKKQQEVELKARQELEAKRVEAEQKLRSEAKSRLNKLLAPKKPAATQPADTTRQK